MNDKCIFIKLLNCFQVVYSQCNLLQSRAKELIATKECRKDEVEAEANKLEEVINNFASRLDDRRDVLVLAIECFKATDNVKYIDCLQFGFSSIVVFGRS